MDKVKLAVLTILLLSTAVFSQTAEDEQKAIEISVCRPSITEAGRSSSFHVNYIYRLTSDESGAVEKIAELSDHKKYRSLMNDESVIPCLEKWRLRPSQKYFVTISVGTSGDNFLSISGKTDKIKINL